MPKLVFDSLNIMPEFKAFESINSKYQCDIYHIFSDLIFARIVQPESSLKHITTLLILFTAQKLIIRLMMYITL